MYEKCCCRISYCFAQWEKWQTSLRRAMRSTDCFNKALMTRCVRAACSVLGTRAPSGSRQHNRTRQCGSTVTAASLTQLPTSPLHPHHPLLNSTLQLLHNMPKKEVVWTARHAPCIYASVYYVVHGLYGSCCLLTPLMSPKTLNVD